RPVMSLPYIHLVSLRGVCESNSLPATEGRRYIRLKARPSRGAAATSGSASVPHPVALVSDRRFLRMNELRLPQSGTSNLLREVRPAVAIHAEDAHRFARVRGFVHRFDDAHVCEAFPAG